MEVPGVPVIPGSIGGGEERQESTLALAEVLGGVERIRKPSYSKQQG